ncbi:unnamed protein product [Ceratitis capitata]|uniref:(Mediterranean fruit fly) hypothetical protein n=1 Tax=Ceratitis capitata TaxID=7213 RepID=A0A811VAR9_CERCA|nr:unnamed protein product [Ceratitis capitata]
MEEKLCWQERNERVPRVYSLSLTGGQQHKRLTAQDSTSISAMVKAARARAPLMLEQQLSHLKDNVTATDI